MNFFQSLSAKNKIVWILGNVVDDLCIITFCKIKFLRKLNDCFFKKWVDIVFHPVSKTFTKIGNKEIRRIIYRRMKENIIRTHRGSNVSLAEKLERLRIAYRKTLS